MARKRPKGKRSTNQRHLKLSSRKIKIGPIRVR